MSSYIASFDGSWVSIAAACTIVTWCSGGFGYIGRRTLALLFYMSVTLRMTFSDSEESDPSVHVVPADVSSENKAVSRKYKAVAKECVTKGDVEGALVAYSRAFLADYKDHETMGDRAAVYMSMKKHREACWDADSCILLAPTAGLGYLMLGRAQSALGHSYDAFYSFFKGLRVSVADDPHREALHRESTQVKLFSHALPILFAPPGVTETLNALNDTNAEFEPYLADNLEAVSAQLDALSVAMHVDLSLLSLFPRVIWTSYDKSVYICSVAMWQAPHLVSKMAACETLVKGLLQAVLRGWELHHGFAKYAAYSLVTVVLSDEFSNVPLRRTTAQQFFASMLHWLNDTTPVFDTEGEDLAGYEVCGCWYMNPRHSASTWLEILFATPTDFVTQQFLEFHDKELLLLKLGAVVREENVISNGICLMLIVPEIAKMVMESDITVNFYLHRLGSGYMWDRDVRLSGGESSLGDWFLLCISHVLVCNEDSQVQGARAIEALLSLIRSVPEGLERFSSIWLSLPVLRCLSSLACHCEYALELLEMIAASGPSSRAAIASLADAYRNGPTGTSGSTLLPPTLFVKHYHLLQTTLPNATYDGISTLTTFDRSVSRKWVKVVADGVEMEAIIAPWAEIKGGPLVATHCTTTKGEAFLDADFAEKAVVVPATLCLPPEDYTEVNADVKFPQHYLNEDPFHRIAAALYERGASAVLFYNNSVPTEEGDSSASLPFAFSDYTGVTTEVQPPASLPPSVMLSGYSAQKIEEGAEILFTESFVQDTKFPGGAAEKDLSKAWGLLEVFSRVEGSAENVETMNALMAEMTIADKSTWLSRRLRRHHAPEDLRGDFTETDEDDWGIVFLECNRGNTLAEHLSDLHQQHRDETGLGSAVLVRGDLEVRFRDESSVGSAVVREALDFIAKSVYLHPASYLLMPCDSTHRYYIPNPAARFANPHWQQEFEILGRLLGLALWQRVTLELPLHPYVWTLLVDGLHNATPPAEPTMETLNKVLPEVHAKLAWIAQNNLEVLGIEMPYCDTLIHSEEENSDNGTASVLPPLVTKNAVLPGDEAVETPQYVVKHTDVYLGSGQPASEDDECCEVVTEGNKNGYAKAVVEWRLSDGIMKQISSIQKGLREVLAQEVATELLGLMRPSDLGEIVSGTPDLDVDDWARYTRYTGMDATAPEVLYFWEVMRSFEKDSRRLANLLQFTTGSRRVPVGGFRYLMGANGGLHLFTISKGVQLTPTSLPESHACICTLDLPPFESLKIATEKLTQITEDCEIAFDEAFAD